MYLHSLIKVFAACLFNGQMMILTKTREDDQNEQMCTIIWAFAVQIWHNNLFYCSQIKTIASNIKALFSIRKY